MAGRDDELEVVRDALSFRALGDGHGFHHFVDSPQIIPAATPHSHDESYEDGYVDAGDEDYSDDGIEFAFAIKDPESRPRIALDDIFSDGRILPVYPVFGRGLLRFDEEETVKDELRAVRRQLRGLSLEEQDQETNPSTEAAVPSPWDSDWVDVGEFDGIPPESYCIWTPGSDTRSPDQCTKSSSTGSTMRCRLRDLVGRSHSEGKEKFVYLAAPQKKIKEMNKAEKEKKAPAGDADKKGKITHKETAYRGKVTDVGTIHRNLNAKPVKPAGGAGRRSFLPYRQEIIGIFAGVNGLSRTYRPY